MNNVTFRASDKGKGRPNIEQRKAIKCKQTGEVFSSLTELSEKIGKRIGNISRHINHDKPELIDGKSYTYIQQP